MLGVGFGPANLALAIALHEQAEVPPQASRTPKCAFLERKSEFSWHRGMLLDDATMQVSFLKDLATLRNPQSRFTFVNFLHEQGRLQEFINFKSFCPLRVEFHDYLSWAAAQFVEQTHYREEVVGIEPQFVRGQLQGFVVRSGNGRVRKTRDVVFAAGLRPTLPAGIATGDRVWHSSQLLNRLGALSASPCGHQGGESSGASGEAAAELLPTGLPPLKCGEPLSVAVIGGGQSAAEVVALLHQRFGNATVHAIHSRFGFAPSDSSPFVNQIFDQDAIRLFHESPPEVRAKILQDHRNTNYAVVDEELILQLYRLSYRERLQGTRRLRFHPLSRVESAESHGDKVHLEVCNLADRSREVLKVDIAIFATGYRSVSPAELLGSARELCIADQGGNLAVDAQYRLLLNVPGDAAIYVQGATEHSHGLGSTLLSNVAHRAQVIADELLSHRLTERQA